MRITFWGAARTVTGSMHLLEVNDTKILLDCGLYQGKRKLSYERNLNFPFPPKDIDALVLSHAHIDHSGNIPNLVRRGFRGNIYATHATRDLCAAMLEDSARIQEQDINFLNKKRRRKGEPPLQPLYTVKDALASLPYFIGLPYWRPIVIAPGVTLTFYDAGHILGSAIVVLDIEERGKKPVRLVFSGDLGRRGLAILRDPEFIDRADYLIMESTYGSRYHESFEDATEKLREISIRAYRQRGRMLVPSFAVGRTQELVYRLNRLRADRDIPEFPIYVDSPLAVNVTEIFRLHPECYDKELRDFMASHDHRSPFGFHLLRYVRRVEDSKALNFKPDPIMVIAASGMCEGGRILHHLKQRISDPNTIILFVGYQAENTLGRKILDGVSPVRIFGELHEVRAQVERIDGYSAHADRTELLDWADHFDRRRLKKIFLVHGEEEGYTGLKSGLEQMGFRHVIVPDRGDSFVI